MRLKRGWLALKRIRVRQSWSKVNLYQLSRLQDLFIQPFNLFQQKWKAKSMTRTYHGAQVPEKQWQRMFRRRVDSVVALDPSYLADHDGSEISAGRGSGKDMKEPQKLGANFIPYMHMTYAPLERRLDTAVFRALFASSIKQARNLILHGHVRVNGQRMNYTGYLLNPGDMFQVDKDLVLLAVGAPKPRPLKQDLAKLKRENAMKHEKSTPEPEGVKTEIKEASESSQKGANGEKGDGVERAPLDDAETVFDGVTKEEQPADEARARQKAVLQNLSSQIKIIMGSELPIDAKRKQGYRAIKKDLRSILPRFRTLEASEVDSKIEEWTLQLARLLPSDPKARSKIERVSAKQNKDSRVADPNSRNVKTEPAKEIPEEPLNALVSLEQSSKALEQTIQQIQYNPKDLSKIYVTPWRPRPYMAPFAFIPRYLEVNHNICAAVYLRHPVARKGMSEVPSPYGPTEMQLAHSWYLRRR